MTRSRTNAATARVASLVLALIGVVASVGRTAAATGADDREFTIGLLRKVADPVLHSLNQERLTEEIPKWGAESDNAGTSALQAFARTLFGMSYWLSLGADETEEGRLRGEYIDLAIQGIDHATNPASPDYLFSDRSRHLIAHGCDLAIPLLIAPEVLWEPLTPRVREQVVAALKLHRNYRGPESNWLLFAAGIECLLWDLTGECEIAPIEYAVKRHMGWYLGDGVYGDGEEFHWDYYNSYTIQPVLLECLRVCEEQGHPLGDTLPSVRERGGRYAEVIEHLVSPEGTFPVIGRSSVYRFGALHHLGYFAWRWGLPPSLSPGATRAAVTQVLRRMSSDAAMFDERGFLRLGVVGHQPSARDYYIVPGSLYNCALGFSHLGLAPDDAFWSDPAGDWFQKKVWSGQDIEAQEPLPEPDGRPIVTVDRYREAVRWNRVSVAANVALLLVLAVLAGWRSLRRRAA